MSPFDREDRLSALYGAIVGLLLLGMISGAKALGAFESGRGGVALLAVLLITLGLLGLAGAAAERVRK